MSERAIKINKAIRRLDTLWQQDRKAYDCLLAALSEGHRPRALLVPTRKQDSSLHVATVYNLFRKEMEPGDKPLNVAYLIQQRLMKIARAIKGDDSDRETRHPWLEHLFVLDYAGITEKSLLSTYNRANERYKADPDFAKFCDRLLTPPSGDEISKEILEGLRTFAKLPG
jgi:hypothetical protein